MSKLIKIDEALKDLVPNYFSSRGKEIALLEGYVKSGDFESIRDIAHDWAGVAPGYGFDELGAIGAKMELEAQKQNLPEISMQIQVASSYLQSIIIEYVSQSNWSNKAK
jgi:HPt (histidine-containing phosphotransfer) domain-containing protein